MNSDFRPRIRTQKCSIDFSLPNVNEYTLNKEVIQYGAFNTPVTRVRGRTMWTTWLTLALKQRRLLGPHEGQAVDA